MNSVIEEKKRKRLARLENREFETEWIPICDISQNFRSAGFVFGNQVNVITDEKPASHELSLVYPCPPNIELDNWKIIELPLIFYSILK